MHGMDSPVAASGKSKTVDIASTLATGHEAGIIALGETREETEKRIGAVILRGDPIIAFDNCERPLEGTLFNQILMQNGVASVRILGFTEMVDVRTTAFITATGNNLTL